MSCILLSYEFFKDIADKLESIHYSFDCVKKQVLPYSLGKFGIDEHGAFDTAMIGQALAELNLKAYEACYGGRHMERLDNYLENYRIETSMLTTNKSKHITDVQFFKMIQSLIYQCEEFESGKEPLLLDALKEFKCKLADYIIEAMPDYDSMAWADTIHLTEVQ